MASRLRLDGAEDIGCAATLVLAVAFGDPAGRGSLRRPDLSVQRDRLLVQADYRL